MKNGCLFLPVFFHSKKAIGNDRTPTFLESTPKGRLDGDHFGPGVDHSEKVQTNDLFAQRYCNTESRIEYLEASRKFRAQKINNQCGPIADKIIS